LTPFLLLFLAFQAAASEPAAAAGAPPAPPVSAAAPAPSAAAPPVPPSAAPSAGAPPPRRIDDLSRPLTGAVPQGSYEEGVKGAFSRTQSLQGPLDGTWTLKDAAGAGLYRVQLVDPGFGGGRMEGAWSDLHAAASGFFTGVSRDGARLILQFTEPGVGVAVATLDPRPGGGFAGELSIADAGREPRKSAVTLVRP
jgi:hypothetical protein